MGAKQFSQFCAGKICWQTGAPLRRRHQGEGSFVGLLTHAIHSDEDAIVAIRATMAFVTTTGGASVRTSMQCISARDLLNVAWIFMRQSIESNDERVADELDRLAGLCMTEARQLDPSLMETYAPSPTMH